MTDLLTLVLLTLCMALKMGLYGMFKGSQAKPKIGLNPMGPPTQTRKYVTTYTYVYVEFVYFMVLKSL